LDKIEKKQFVKDFRPKDDVDSIFLVKHIAVMEAKDGKNYLNLVLMDASGDLEARKWHGAQEVYDNVAKGDYVRIRGKINNFQGRLQVIVTEVFCVSEQEVEKGDFTPRTQGNTDKMFKSLLQIVDHVDDVYIRDLLKNILFDSDIERRLKLWYAGKTIHHAYEGGLLEHILSCSELALSLSKHYQVNHNFVVAGAILHDLCKIYELTEGPLVDYTDEGKLIGHLVKAVELIDHFAGQIKNFPYETKTHLKHIIISHHGELAFGSPKLPQSEEAFLVHLIDLMDSKMNSLKTIKHADKTPGRWSQMVRHLDRVVYKPELPHYSEYVSDKAFDKSEPNSAKNNVQNDPALKYSLAKALSGFKLED